MNVLCPSCQSSIAAPAGGATAVVLVCDSCGLSAQVSQLGTTPGVLPVPLSRDFSGEVVGEYRLEERIGAGGMGAVYRARCASDDAVVAVKILHGDIRWNRDQFVARFAREAEALYQLVHENIVRIIGHGRIAPDGDGDDVHYLVMEFVAGENLADYARDRTPSSDEIVDIMHAVCQGIGFAHENGIVHRDLKPANIIVSPGGRVKVLDFGLARITGVDARVTSLTRTDLAMGTFNYLSPEQRRSAKTVDARSDIFSLGVILYELMTGTLPIGSFSPPSEHGHPRRCDDIVKRALAPDPERRFQSAAELATALNGLRSRPRAFGRRVAQGILAAAVLGGGLLFAYAGGYLGGTQPAADGDVAAVAEPDAREAPGLAGTGADAKSPPAADAAALATAVPVDAGVADATRNVADIEGLMGEPGRRPTPSKRKRPVPPKRAKVKGGRKKPRNTP